MKEFCQVSVEHRLHRVLYNIGGMCRAIRWGFIASNHHETKVFILYIRCARRLHCSWTKYLGDHTDNDDWSILINKSYSILKIEAIKLKLFSKILKVNKQIQWLLFKESRF